MTRPARSSTTTSAADEIDQWAEAALAARVAQGLPEHVEDSGLLDFLAAALRSAKN
jgi:hypothetical protein